MSRTREILISFMFLSEEVIHEDVTSETRSIEVNGIFVCFIEVALTCGEVFIVISHFVPLMSFWSPADH